MQREEKRKDDKLVTKMMGAPGRSMAFILPMIWHVAPIELNIVQDGLRFNFPPSSRISMLTGNIYALHDAPC